MSNAGGEFIWYELMTPDPAGAKAFYDAVIGWNIQARGMVMPNGSEYRMIGRSDGGNAGGLLSLGEGMLQTGARPAWIGYVHVTDVDAAVRQVIDAGGKVHMAATNLPVGRMAMIADPWGATLYLMAPVPPPGQPDAKSDVFSVSEPQHVRWNELWAPDPEAALAFYTKLFGWTVQGSMPMGAMGVYTFIGHEGTAIGAVGQARPDGPGPRWSYAIGVDDIDRAVAAARAGGGTVYGEPQQVPGGEYSLYCRDPQGAAFALVGPRKE